MSQRSNAVRQMVGLLAVAAVVGLVAYFGIYKKDEHETKVKAHEQVMFTPANLDERLPDGGAPEGEFTTVKIFAKGETTTLAREPGAEWRIVEPVKSRADKLVIDQIVTQLQTAKFRTKLEEAPSVETLKTYGLQEPSFLVEATATLNGTARTVKLKGGIDNAFDGTVYMQRNDDPAVYLAEGGIRWALARNTFDLREKEVFALDESKVAKLVVKTSANDWEMERNSAGQWKLTRPIQNVVDTTTITAMLGGLRSEKAYAFLQDLPAVRADAGLDAPLVEAWVTSTDGSVRHLRVAGDHGEWYALAEGPAGTVIAQVSPSMRGWLDRNAADLRDRSIVPFNRDLVSSITINRDGVEFTVEKDAPDASADTWKIVKPTRQAAKVFRVSALLYALGGVKYTGIADAKPKDLAKYGITSNSRYISLGGPFGEVARLTVGGLMPGQDKMVYVKGVGPEVFQTDGSRFEELAWKVSDLADVPVPADAGK